MLLHIYFQALLRWGLWEETISDHGGQFNDHDWIRVNERLGIHHEMYPKGRPWQNLIESYFGIEADLTNIAGRGVRQLKLLRNFIASSSATTTACRIGRIVVAMTGRTRR